MFSKEDMCGKCQVRHHFWKGPKWQGRACGCQHLASPKNQPWQKGRTSFQKPQRQEAYAQKPVGRHKRQSWGLKGLPGHSVWKVRAHSFLLLPLARVAALIACYFAPKWYMNLKCCMLKSRRELFSFNVIIRFLRKAALESKQNRIFCFIPT